MKYVALLRGINVGGNNKVEMPRLKSQFEKLGYTHVKTYINSGNVIFESTESDKTTLTSAIEVAIEQEFGFYVKVIVISQTTINDICKSTPLTWMNNSDMKTDVMFLWEKYDSPKTLEILHIKPELDDVFYRNGAILWHVDRKNVSKSGLLKIVGTDLYKHMTIRNINTIRKLNALMSQNK